MYISCILYQYNCYCCHYWYHHYYYVYYNVIIRMIIMYSYLLLLIIFIYCFMINYYHHRCYSTVCYTIIIYPFFILCHNMKYDHPKSLNKNKKKPNITIIYQTIAHKSPKNLRHRLNGHPQTIQAPSTAPWGPQRCH